MKKIQTERRKKESIMHPEKTERLFEEFPELFKRGQLIHGFECQDGWFELIRTLAGPIKEYQVQFPDLENIEVAQVFQKMGGLRINIRGGDSNIQNLIRKIEQESRSICELDGEPAAGLFVCAPSWFRCLCKRCSELHGYMTIDNYLCEKSIAPPIQNQIQHSV
jgi:hypothetical protein